jgi:hypothetical protein
MGARVLFIYDWVLIGGQNFVQASARVVPRASAWPVKVVWGFCFKNFSRGLGYLKKVWGSWFKALF